MAKPKLPTNLRKDIKELFGQGNSTIEIFDLVFDEAMPYVESNEQLARCIAAITRRRPSEKGFIKAAKGHYSIPKPKLFDSTKHCEAINKLSENMQEKEFETSCHDVVLDILTNYEGFQDIEDANKASGFTNPPFDFLAFKDGEPYMIEFKGSLHSFNAPGETQKRRMKVLLGRIADLNVALLQVKLKKSEYRIFYNQEMNVFFDGKKMPMKPIEKWIKGHIEEHQQKS